MAKRSQVMTWIRQLHPLMLVAAAAAAVAEALDTAIEEIVDLVTPEWSLPTKHAKDLGSFAVFYVLCLNGIFALFVILTTLNWN